jgi:hypothetical protein
MRRENMNEIRELNTAEMEQVAGGFLDFYFITYKTNISNSNSSGFATGVSQIGLSAGNIAPISTGIGAILSHFVECLNLFLRLPCRRLAGAARTRWAALNKECCNWAEFGID